MVSNKIREPREAFIAFLALIIKSEMSNVINSSVIIRHNSRVEISKEMSILRRACIDGRKIIYSERTSLQKRVISAFGIKAPFKDEVE